MAHQLIIRVLVAVALLTQGAMALGVGRRTVFLGHAWDCAAHVQDPCDDGLSEAHPGEVHEVACDLAPLPEHCDARCCPCPHVHVSVGPMAAADGRQQNGQVPHPGPDIATPQPPQGPEGIGTFAWRVHPAALTSHPPPVGLRTTRLLI